MQLAGVVEDTLEIGDTGEHGGNLGKMQFRLGGQQPRDGGFADPRRTPEDQRGKRAALEHEGKAARRPKQMLLPGNIGDKPRPQPLGKRLRG